MIEYGGEVAGALGLRLNWLRGPYIQFLGVVPGYQNSGIGARVLDWVGTGAAAGDGAAIYGSPLPPSTPERCASTSATVSRRVASLDGLIQDGCDEILLRKRL